MEQTFEVPSTRDDHMHVQSWFGLRPVVRFGSLEGSHESNPTRRMARNRPSITARPQQVARNEAVQAMAARAVGGPQWKDDRLAEDCESCGIEFNILVSPPATEIAKLRVPRKALLSGSAMRASSAPSNSRSRLAWPAIPHGSRGVRCIAY